MRLLARFHLNPVLDHPQELVSGSQRGVVAVGKPAFVVEFAQGEKGSARPHPVILQTVQPLQALHQELDVADARLDGA
jgi:hypothetical protein